MKYRYLLVCLVASLSIISCRETPTPATEMSVKERFAPLIHGQWELAAYLDDLEKTRSPYESSKLLDDIVAVFIDTARIQGDSLEVGGSVNNHEGLSFYVYFEEGGHPGYIEAGYSRTDKVYQISVTTKGNDTMLELYTVHDGKVEDTVVFRKVPMTKGEPFEYSVNRILLSGHYNYRDSLGQAKAATFEDNSKMQGFGSFSHYYVGTDFNSPDECDYIVLISDNEQDRAIYSFESVGDSLKLFETTPNEADGVVKAGLKTIMIRQANASNR